MGLCSCTTTNEEIVYEKNNSLNNIQSEMKTMQEIEAEKELALQKKATEEAQITAYQPQNT